MKGVVALIIVVLLLVAIGWIGFGRNSGNPTIEFRQEKAKSDVKQMIERVEENVSSDNSKTVSP
ncbi:MAG: hypothetical protein U0930_04345 [Pirellulales bacterium]